jgi:hypothetical protein
MTLNERTNDMDIFKPEGLGEPQIFNPRLAALKGEVLYRDFTVHDRHDFSQHRAIPAVFG